MSDKKLPEPIKVHNQGGRLFTHHELHFKPGKTTEVPPEHVEAVLKLLKDYPTELVTDDQANLRAAQLTQNIAELRSMNADLNRQLAILKDAANGNEDPGTIANLQAKLKAATDEIASLKHEHASAKTRISQLDAQLSGKKK